MNYIVCKKFNGKGLDGMFNLSKGSTCNEQNGFICHNNSKVCAKTSKNAFEFFARNDDGRGTERYAVVNEIIEKIKEYVGEDNEELLAIQESDLSDEQKATEINELKSKSSRIYDAIRERYPNFLRNGMDVFSFDFYNAEVEDLIEARNICLAV